MENIEGGFISEVGQFLKKAYNTIFNCLEMIVKWGTDVENMKQNKDGSYECDLIWSEDEDDPIHLLIEPHDDGTMNLTFSREKQVVETLKNVKQDQLEEIADKVVFEETGSHLQKAKNKKNADVKNSASVVSTKSINAAFQFVNSRSDSTINLVSVRSDYSPAETLVAIQDIVNNDEFAELLSEHPEDVMSFEISEEDSEWDVNNCDNCCTECEDCGLTEVLKALYGMLFGIQSVHWNAKGEDFFQLHEKLDEYISEARDQVDELSEMIVELTGSIGNPIDLICQVSDERYLDIITTGFTIESGFQRVRDLIGCYLQALDCYYCNQKHDIQSEFDSWIRYWSKEANYKLAAQQE